MKSHTIKIGFVGAGLSAAFFALCMAWGFLITDLDLQALHLNILRITYPGFSMSFAGVVLGIIGAVAYGFIFGVLFDWLCKVSCVGRHQNSPQI